MKSLYPNIPAHINLSLQLAFELDENERTSEMRFIKVFLNKVASVNSGGIWRGQEVLVIGFTDGVIRDVVCSMDTWNACVMSCNIPTQSIYPMIDKSCFISVEARIPPANRTRETKRKFHNIDIYPCIVSSVKEVNVDMIPMLEIKTVYGDTDHANLTMEEWNRNIDMCRKETKRLTLINDYHEEMAKGNKLRQLYPQVNTTATATLFALKNLRSEYAFNNLFSVDIAPIFVSRVENLGNNFRNVQDNVAQNILRITLVNGIEYHVICTPERWNNTVAAATHSGRLPLDKLYPELDKEVLITANRIDPIDTLSIETTIDLSKIKEVTFSNDKFPTVEIADVYGLFTVLKMTKENWNTILENAGVKTVKEEPVVNKIDEMIKVMEAYKNGATIEFEDGNGKWEIIDNPHWNWHKVAYRVQEEIRDSIDWSHVHKDYKWLVRDKKNNAWLVKSFPELTATGWKLAVHGPSVEAESFASYVKGNTKWQHSVVSRPHSS